MPESGTKLHLEEDISIHIFTVSASLVGVCLTVIGIIHLITGLLKINTIVDDLLAIDSFIFLCSCLLSYWALRTRTKRRMYHIERVADAIFMIGLIMMVVASGFIVYAVA
jgi:hypothetical protein